MAVPDVAPRVLVLLLLVQGGHGLDVGARCREVDRKRRLEAREKVCLARHDAFAGAVPPVAFGLGTTPLKRSLTNSSGSSLHPSGMVS